MHPSTPPSTDYPALARCLFESYEEPPQRFFHVWFPTPWTCSSSSPTPPTAAGAWVSSSLDWGIQKADKPDFDLFLDSSPHGRSAENLVIPKTDNPDEKWNEMEERVGPFTFWLMWRPVHGVYEGRETQSFNRREFNIRQCWAAGWNDLEEYGIDGTY
ncbi:hypothetical protein PG988_012728 [Apiospora saccharicola]